MFRKKGRQTFVVLVVDFIRTVFELIGKRHTTEYRCSWHLMTRETHCCSIICKIQEKIPYIVDVNVIYRSSQKTPESLICSVSGFYSKNLDCKKEILLNCYEGYCIIVNIIL